MKHTALRLGKWLMVPLFALTLGGCAILETTRNVYVNGERQNAFGVAAFDQQTGWYLPDGRYWTNWTSGDWGVEGSRKILGNVHKNAAAARASNNSRGGSSGGGGGGSGGSTSNSVNGTAGTGRDAEGRNCAFVSLPNGQGMMSCN